MGVIRPGSLGRSARSDAAHHIPTEDKVDEREYNGN